jgi:hypothetical protein
MLSHCTVLAKVCYDATTAFPHEANRSAATVTAGCCRESKICGILLQRRWIRVAAGKTIGRRPVPLTVKITGLVDICFEGPAKEVAT